MYDVRCTGLNQWSVFCEAGIDVWAGDSQETANAIADLLDAEMDELRHQLGEAEEEAERLSAERDHWVRIVHEYEAA